METPTESDVTTDRIGLSGNVPIDGIGLSVDITSDRVEQVGGGPDVTTGDVWPTILV